MTRASHTTTRCLVITYVGFFHCVLQYIKLNGTVTGKRLLQGVAVRDDPRNEWVSPCRRLCVFCYETLHWIPSWAFFCQFFLDFISMQHHQCTPAEGQVATLPNSCCITGTDEYGKFYRFTIIILELIDFKRWMKLWCSPVFVTKRLQGELFVERCSICGSDR